MPAADGAGGLALNAPQIMVQNALYFVQGAAYPFTWAGGWLRDRFDLDGFLLTALLALPAVAVALWAQARAGWTRRSALPWLWTAVAGAPAVLFLPWLHVSAAPRMLMLASVGLAWLWSDVLWALARGAAWRRALAALLLAALLLQNGLFVRAQLALYAIGGDAIRGAVSAAETAGRAAKRPCCSTSPPGSRRSAPLTRWGRKATSWCWGRSCCRRWCGRTAGRPWTCAPCASTPSASSRRPTSPVRWATARRGTRRGRRPFSTPFTSPTLSGCGPRLLAGTAAFTQQELQIDLTWRLPAAAPADVTVFVHVLDAAGRLIAQADSDPLAGAFPLAQWPVGTVLTDQRVVAAADDAVVVHVGLYSRGTGERETAVGPDGAAWADSAVVIPVGR